MLKCSAWILCSTIYFFITQVAIYPHKRRNSAELDLEVGDVIGVAGNHWDGFNKETLAGPRLNLYRSNRQSNVLSFR